MVGTRWWRGGRSAPTAAQRYSRQRVGPRVWAVAKVVVRWAFIGLVMLSTVPIVARAGAFTKINFDALASKALPMPPSRFSSERSSIHERLGQKQLKSTEGQPIALWSVASPAPSPLTSKITPAAGDQEPVKRFLVQGGLHGNEVATSKFVRWLYRRVSAGTSVLNKLPGRFAIDFIPYANPDRFGKSRYNANFVNLNRNFGAFWGRSFEPNGSKPFSEKETHAIRSLMKSSRYLAAVDVHGYAKWIVAPSQNPKGHTLTDFQMARYQRWRADIKSVTGEALPGYQVVSALGLGDGGSFEDWSFWHNDTLAICLEMSSAKRFVSDKKSLIDMFPRYEQFIYLAFQKAIAFDRNVSLAANP